MVCGNIQLGEVVIIVLDFRTFDDFVAHADENALNFLKRNRIRMAVANEFHLSRQGHVDLLSRELLLHLESVETLFGLFHLRFDRVTCVVDPLADLRPVFRRDILHGFEDSRKGTLFT